MKCKKLSSKEMAQLKALAHHLNAVVLIGQQGLTDAVVAEVECHLVAHELIKIQVASDERQERVDVAERLCAKTGAVLVQHIGKQLVLFRLNPDSQFQWSH